MQEFDFAIVGAGIAGVSAAYHLAPRAKVVMLEREHVAVTPGEAFGAPGYLRLSYATSMERIDEGLRRLARFFGNAA